MFGEFDSLLTARLKCTYATVIKKNLLDFQVIDYVPGIVA